MIRQVGRALDRGASSILIVAILIYQRTLSPLLGPACRFEPSCSRYMVGAVRKYGLIRGFWKGLMRFLRCHPWHPGGYDPP
jgi:putative membrane protein insertion efficiency factor